MLSMAREVPQQSRNFLKGETSRRAGRDVFEAGIYTRRNKSRPSNYLSAKIESGGTS